MDNVSEKKYELVLTDTKFFDDVILYRIRALRDFGNVRAGDLGGYVQSENNLSHTDNAWISGNSRVLGNARISGNAYVYDNARISGSSRVFGNAQVSGDAWIYDNAQVSGHARISGSSRVFGNAQVSGDARISGDAVIRSPKDIVWFSNVGSENGTLTVFKDSKIDIRFIRGCFIGDKKEFLGAVKNKHGDSNTAVIYRLLVEAAELKILGNDG